MSPVHENSLSNLRPREPILEGQKKRPTKVQLSQRALHAADELATRRGMLHGDKPNRSAAIGYALEAIAMIMEQGGTATFRSDGTLKIKSERE